VPMRARMAARTVSSGYLSTAAATSAGVILAFMTAEPAAAETGLPESAFGAMTQLPDSVVDALNELKAAKELAKAAVTQRDLPKAERAYIVALAAARHVDQMHTGGELNNLAEICRAQGKLEESAAYLEEAIQIMTAVYGQDHGLVGFMYHNLGKVRAQQKDWAASCQMFKLACTIRRDTNEMEPLANSYLELGRVCLDLGDQEGAATALGHCVTISEGLQEVSAASLIGRRMEFTTVLLALGREHEAELTQRKGLLRLDAPVVKGGVALSASAQKALNGARFTLANVRELMHRGAQVLIGSADGP
jgi:tetratricopeptide (TPR) repeat protein